MNWSVIAGIAILFIVWLFYVVYKIEAIFDAYFNFVAWKMKQVNTCTEEEKPKKIGFAVGNEVDNDDEDAKVEE